MACGSSREYAVLQADTRRNKRLQILKKETSKSNRTFACTGLEGWIYGGGLGDPGISSQDD